MLTRWTLLIVALLALFSCESQPQEEFPAEPTAANLEVDKDQLRGMVLDSLIDPEQFVFYSPIKYDSTLSDAEYEAKLDSLKLWRINVLDTTQFRFWINSQVLVEEVPNISFPHIKKYHGLDNLYAFEKVNNTIINTSNIPYTGSYQITQMEEPIGRGTDVSYLGNAQFSEVFFSGDSLALLKIEFDCGFECGMQRYVYFKKEGDWRIDDIRE